jgi:hypothetical protein
MLTLYYTRYSGKVPYSQRETAIHYFVRFLSYKFFDVML